ncbi:MAG: Asp23/Gls24 family envelope stress response protein [Anaerolineae bacterium]|nr:Asp23/Gls24 family envelope stress response protein [Anaerolineae bacterium]MDW8101066.1 Asp23/Gls24 family envelope stress response protein [Anaerolineae bacterium]
MTEGTSLGKIDISPDAIAAIASAAVLECYGVVGMASKDKISGLAELLPRYRSRRGVEVTMSEGRIIVDLYVIVEYGTRISEVAYGVMNRVKFSLEQVLGVPVAEVNVHIQGLRVSSSD